MSRHLRVGLAMVVLCAFGILVEAAAPRGAAGAIRSLPGFSANAFMPGDDFSSFAVPLGFTVNFLGLPFSTVFVNNNGNVTFDAPLTAFTPFDLTSTQRQIIAPFWADVDTRGFFMSMDNIVTFGSDVVNGRAAFGATWTTVGYFFQHTDKRNTFQVVLIDRSETGSGNFDIEFNYEQIQWETGDFSGGQNGLGGTSARVGFSNGTGIPGTFFELPGSAIPGSFLDSSPTGGLVANRMNSSLDGRYVFAVREGTVFSQFRLTVVKLGSGNGTVTGPGIECGTQCTGSFNPGTRLQATAAPGSSFAGWGVSCGGTALCVLGMSADATVTATFVRIPKGVGLQTGGANADSLNPAVSGNGQFVVYESAATTLTADCPSGGQIYLRDRATGVITCISRSPGGAPGNGPSMLPAISLDGQIIAFQSTAGNLASPCGGGTSQVFVHDRTTGTTTCASVAIGGGTAGNQPSQQAALSADGRFVAFRSLATNLGSCPNGVGQVFVRNRQAGTTACVSLAGGGQGNGSSANPVLSGDGQFVAFDSTATNLGSCPSGLGQIFVRDRTGGTTTCESVGPGDVEGDGPSLAPALDASGNVLAFESTATNLADPCTGAGGFSQIFVRDRTTGITRCASVAPDGSPGDGPSTEATLSANGGRLAFVSQATNLFSSGVPTPAAFSIRQTPSDTDQVLGSDIGGTGSGDGLDTSFPETLSESGSGDLGAASSGSPALNADGSIAVFDSAAQNLTNDVNPAQDVLSVQVTGRARFTDPAQGTQLNLDTPTVVTINWTAVGGAALYGVEFTGANRPFTNPNAAGPDPVNGFGGAGGAFTAPGTSVAGAIDASIPPGVYQIRVLGLTAGLQPIGTFSDALTLILGFSQRPAFISPANGTVLPAGTALTLAWTPVPGAVQYGIEFTGPNRQFANPNGTANDPVNGFGGAGGGSLAAGTGFTVTLPAGIPPGSYQIRVVGLTAGFGLVGVFSDAVTVVFP